ncbi:hypothetical protein EDC30_11929 [Paucimonas lemoignei]|uniref:Uncharacterized protein n=1 Tax=Paucimonas lemoignei TaxID=29443 RepID=A0A4V6NXX0_PAULE|nr:hypothetical protein [Paucimonas lemoignei]TCS32918.1 hypothetical protein EDC30_11929 [Paucimonas lemoignei]
MKLTNHASIRLQQRGIPPIVVDLLLGYGSIEKAGKDAVTYYFDKASRRKISAYAGQLFRAIEGFLDYYAVVGSDGNVITVAPRVKKVKHH